MWRNEAFAFTKTSAFVVRCTELRALSFESACDKRAYSGLRVWSSPMLVADHPILGGAMVFLYGAV
jgi:hypothetical protein